MAMPKYVGESVVNDGRHGEIQGCAATAHSLRSRYALGRRRVQISGGAGDPYHFG